MNKPKSNNKFTASPAIYFERMEPRVLLSVDAAAGLISTDPFNSTDRLNASLDLSDSLDLLNSYYSPNNFDAQNDDSSLSNKAFNLDDLGNVLKGSDDSIKNETDSVDQLSEYFLSFDDEQAERQEIIFIDSATPDYQTLLDGITENNSTDYLIVILQSDEDGIEQINNVLSQFTDIEAVHLISHGNEEGIQLGDTWLDQSSIQNYTKTISAWSDLLDEDADILLYGCDLASAEAGQQLLTTLSTLTNADIAASDDLTGAIILGGDWDLEYQQGHIETSVAISNAAQQSWNYALTVNSIWASTLFDVSASTTPGLASWTDGEVVQIGDPNLSLDPAGAPVDTTDGTFSSLVNFNLFNATEDSDVAVDAMHYVSSNITVGTGTTFDLLVGDLLVSTEAGETLTSTNTLAVGKNDVFVFRPDTAGDYSSGSFYMLLDDVSDGNTQIRGITLVETDTVVTAGTTLTAGTFLFTQKDNGATADPNIIYTYSGYDIATPASGTIATLVDGDDVGILADINGLDLVETTTTIAGTTLTQGTILVASSTTETVGTNSVAVTEFDIFALNLTNTNLDAANAVGTATLIFDGSDVNLATATAQELDAFTLVDDNAAPSISVPNSVFINELHYDNSGVDANEAVEVMGPAGTDLTGWSLEFYNGVDGSLYNTVALSGTLADQSNGFGTFSINVAGIENGDTSADGIALINASSQVVQFISYEGAMTALAGTANGMTSTDIGVTEDGTAPDTESLQLTGTGSTFTWATTSTSNFGSINTDQSVFATDTTLEDTDLVYTHAQMLALIGASDADDPDENLSVNITNVVNGSIALDLGTGGAGETFTFTPTANFEGSVTFDYQVLDDDSAASAIGNGIFTVTGSNDEPTITATGANPSFTEGGAAISLFTGTNINPIEAGQTIEQLLFTVTNVTDGTNEIISIDGQNITLTNANSGTTTANSYGYSISLTGSTATVILTTTGTTPANAQTLVDGLSYENTAADPSTANRVVTITSMTDSGGTANSGDDTVAAAIVSTVTVQSVNDEPTISATAANPTFTEGGAATSLFSGTSINPIEAGQTIEQLLFTVSNVSDGTNEIISIDGQNITLTNANSGTTVANSYGYSISLVANTATVTLTTTGTTPANAQTLVDGLSYENSAADPSTANRVVTITSMTDSGGTANSGDDTVAAAIVSTVTVQSVNDEPTISATAANPTFTEGGAATSLFSGTSINSIEAGQTIEQLLFTVSNVTDGTNEIISIDGQNITLTNGNSGTTVANSYGYNVSLVANTATVTLTTPGTTPANAQTLVDGLAYENTAAAPTTANRVVTITSMTDSGGTANGGDDTVATAIASTVTVQTVNAEPTITATASNPTFTEGGAATSLFSGTSINAIEAGQTIEQLVFTVSNVSDGTNEIISIDGQNLTLTNANTGTTVANSVDYSISLVANTATVTLTTAGTTPANAQTLVDGLAYENTAADPTTANRVVTISSMTDSGGTANGGDDTVVPAIASTVTLVAINDEPIITATASNPTFTEGGAATSLFSGTSINAIEAGQTIEQLVFTVSNVSDGTNEIISIDGQNLTLTNANTGTTVANSYDYSISLVANTATVTLTTAGTTPANAQTLVDGLSYENSAADPTTVNRVVTITSMTDSGGTANGGDNTVAPAITSTVTVVSINFSPTATNLNSTSNYFEDDASVAITDIVISDLDGNDVITATLTLSDISTGVLSSNDGATYDAVTGIWSLTDTVTNANTALANLVFTPNLNSDVNSSISVSIDDGDEDLSAPLTGTIALNVTAVNDAPVGTVTIDNMTPSQGDTLTASNTISDVDGITGSINYQWQRDGVDITGATLNSYTTSQADVGTVISLLASYTDNLGTAETVSSSATPAVVDVNDVPVATNLTSNSTYVSGASVVPLADIIVSDIDIAESITASLTLADISAGSLSQNDGALYNSLTGEWSITGSVSAVNTALSNLVFMPTVGASQDTSINILIDDGDEDSGGPLIGNLSLKAVTPVVLAPVIITTPDAEEESDLSLELDDNVADEPEPETESEETLEEASTSSAANAEESTSIANQNNNPDAVIASLADQDNAEVNNASVENSVVTIGNRNANAESIGKDVQSETKIVRLQEQFSVYKAPLALFESNSFVSGLDKMRDDLISETEDTEKVVGSSLAFSAGVSIGYVVWLARSGVLLTSVLSSLPAWRFIDPLPVLSSLGQGDMNDDSESLESIVGGEDVDSDEENNETK